MVRIKMEVYCMKKLFVLVMLLLSLCAFVSSISAAPFLVCDPQTGVTHYKFTGPAWIGTQTLAQPNGSLQKDVAAATAGTNSITIAACITDALWGELCSATVPFVFTRPAAPSTPVNTKLTP